MTEYCCIFSAYYNREGAPHSQSQSTANQRSRLQHWFWLWAFPTTASTNAIQCTVQV